MTAVREVAQTRAATLAGAMYLLQMTTAVAGYLVRWSLGVPGDAAATAQNILRAERLYRLSIVADLVTIVAVVELTWALYVLLKPVSSDLALLAALFRIVENAMLGVMAVALLVGLSLIGQPDYLNAFEGNQLDGLARVFRIGHGIGFNAGFIFLGCGSTVFAYLLLKSGYVPRMLAGWGIFASLMLATCALLTIVFPAAASSLQIASFGPMGLYEVGLGAWLLMKGANLTAPAAGVV